MARLTLLEAPGVRFAPGYAARLEGLVRRAAGARERGAFEGRGKAPGAGDEFVGHRPYRPGEDVRHLDWSLLARLERPFVRVHRREAGERWLLLVDTSASMGLGAPGKLKLAAELALALAALGHARGARVELLAAAPGGGRVELAFARRRDLPRWKAALEALRSERGAGEGEAGLSALIAHAAGARRRSERLVLLGDFLALEPARLLALQRPGRRVELVQLLAPHELDPARAGAGAVQWRDREDAGRLDCVVDERALSAYGRALSRNLDAWQRTCARHGLAWSTWSSATPFEDVARALLGL